MNGLTQDFRYALRQLRKAPVFTITAVLTLALGIGANTAIFTVFNQVLLRLLPVRHPEELVRLSFVGSDMGRASSFGGDSNDYFSYPMYRHLRDRNSVFSGVLANNEIQVGLVWQNQPELVDAEMVSGNYFDVLGVSPVLGRLLVPADDAVKNGSPVVVLSHAYWKTRFNGAPEVINASVLINGHPFTVVGVAAAHFNSAINGYNPKIFAPITMKPQLRPSEEDDVEDPRSRSYNLVARLKPGVTIPSATAAMTPLWRTLRSAELEAKPMGGKRFRDRFVAQSSLVLHENSKGVSPVRDGLRTPLLILMAMVLLLAAMTCVNLTSLLLVRAAARGREFAVRYALGAARGRILRQMLLEGLLLGSLGGVLGLLLAPASAAVLIRMISGTARNGSLPYSVSPDATVLWFTIAISLAISILFSMAPGLQMMKPNLNQALRQQASSTQGTAQSFRKTAIAVQIGLSVLLLTGAGLFLRTLNNLKHQQLGMRTDHVVEFGVEPSMAGYRQTDAAGLQSRVQAALAALPGVESVGATTDPVLAGNSSSGNITVEGYAAKEDEDTNSENPHITPGYFKTLGIPLLVGRDITVADSIDAAKVAIVNRSFAIKFFGSAQNALGHFMASGAGNKIKLDMQIVGVAADSKHSGVRDKPIITYFRPFAQDKSGGDLMYYVRTAQAPELAENDVRAALHGIDSKLVPDSIKTLDEQVDNNISNERVIALLATSFALLALLTTAVGLYGVLAYATTQRTREIGIRMALGAQRRAVVQLVLREMVLIAGIGIAVALPVSVALSRLMRSQLFEVSPFDPLTLVGCVLATVLMVLAAAALPARRAASVEPTQALRTE